MRQTQREWPDSGPAGPGPERLIAPESLAQVLVAATARALRGEDCADVGRQPVLSRLRGTPEPVRRIAVTRAAGRVAVTAEQAASLDAERVARWLADQYSPEPYPGVAFGSPSGAAAHLAAALGMPWLPVAFEICVQWPTGRVDDPVAALRYGAALAERILAANPGLSLRQVHDPATRGGSAGTSISLIARWTRLPQAYRRLLDARLMPGAPVLLLRDARTWPVVFSGGGHSFQVGGVTSGLDPADFQPGGETLGTLINAVGGDPARWRIPTALETPHYAEHGVEPGFEASLRDRVREVGSPLHRILAPRPEALSAAVADLYRGWLRAAGKTGNRCVVECGRLIDPWQVIRSGLVPYWCENASRRSVAGAEWWLAGSPPFTSVDVLPEPPGLRSPALAELPQWLAVASFGGRRRAVDRLAARAYPIGVLPTRRATEVLRAQPCDLPVPAPLRVAQVLAALRDRGVAQGLLVC